MLFSVNKRLYKGLRDFVKHQTFLLPLFYLEHYPSGKLQSINQSNKFIEREETNQRPSSITRNTIRFVYFSLMFFRSVCDKICARQHGLARKKIHFVYFSLMFFRPECDKICARQRQLARKKKKKKVKKSKRRESLYAYQKTIYLRRLLVSTIYSISAIRSPHVST